MEKSKKIIILFAVLFFVASLARIAPVLYKGYAPTGGHDNLVLSRNLSETGEYSLENEKNVILSSDKIKEEGMVSTFGNKLSIILSAQVFKVFGFSANLPFYVSVFLFALTTAMIFLLVLRVFDNFWLAFIVASLDLAMPFVWKGALFAGTYEFASVFFLAGLLVYFWNKKVNNFALVFSSSFLGLAIVSRNAFLLSVIPIIIYEFFKNCSFKRVLCFGLPALLIFVSVGLFNNSYLTSTDESFARYGHLFPDPYTYHFEKESYIESIKGTRDPDFIEFASKYGYETSFFQKIKMYFNSAIFYPKQSFSLINFGGPFFLFLGILGAIFLYRDKREILQFFGIWLVFWYLGLIALKTNNWDHFLEIRFILVVLIALGAWNILTLIKEKKLQMFFVGFLFLQLFFANKWLFHQDYETSFLPEAVIISEEINKSDVSDDEIIAVSFNQNAPLILNYYTNKNFVYFAPETIEKLEQENKLEEVFKEFGVTRYLVK